MSNTSQQAKPIATVRQQPRLWSERATAAASRFHPRLARAEIDLLVTLAIFSGVGLLSSLLLLILDHQFNGQLTTL
jgi:hypothetical protein